MTRLEGIAELVLFMGPFLLLFCVRGLFNQGPSVGFRQLTWAVVGSFALALAAGAYRTGETARAALFLYPFLMLPVGGELEEIVSQPAGYTKLSAIVFAQALIMQYVGDYWW